MEWEILESFLRLVKKLVKSVSDCCILKWGGNVWPVRYGFALRTILLYQCAQVSEDSFDVRFQTGCTI